MKDELLNSKNEYNANCLARVVVEESKFEKKKREKLEEISEAKEKKAWEDFRNKHAGFRKRQRQDAGQHNTVPKGWRDRGKPSKRLKMTGRYQGPVQPDLNRGKEPQHRQLVEDGMDLGLWWEVSEGMCQRAGRLKKILELDKQRVLRRMETLELDRIISDLPAWWKIHDGGRELGGRHPIKKPSRSPNRDDTVTRCAGGAGGQQECVDSREGTDCNTGPAKITKNTAKHNLTGSRTTMSWYSHLTGLVGWWRRVEHEQTKLEDIRRRTEENSRKINECRRREGDRRNTFIQKLSKLTPSNLPNNGLTNRNNRILSSPYAKRKVGEGEHLEEFFSPAKKLRFQNTLKYWENIESENDATLYLTQRSGNLAELPRDLTANPEADNSFGGI